MFHDFQLSITHLGADKYYLRTERVTNGVPHAEDQVEWPIDFWLKEACLLMNDPLSRLLQGTGRLSEDIFISPNNGAIASAKQSPPNDLLNFGQKLYDALFASKLLNESWLKAQGIAHRENAILRLRLGMRESRLLGLPWEVLNYLESDPLSASGISSASPEIHTLTTGLEVSFSRYHNKLGAAKNPAIAYSQQTDNAQPKPLKILMILASPKDQESLQLRQEALHLQAELEKETPADMPGVELTVLDNPGREEITEALEQGQFQVFHYAGHSNLGDAGGDIYLVNRITGLTETLAGEDLAGLLANNGVQFAVFNSCQGANVAAAHAEYNGLDQTLAQALIRKEIPAVLAMAARIPDQVALTFTRLLYRNLHQGYPIDFSLGRVRQSLISAYGSRETYWALPVLYMDAQFDGLLHHRPLNANGLVQLLRHEDMDVPPLSPEDKALLALKSVDSHGSAFLDEDDDDEKLAVIEKTAPTAQGDDVSFIKDLLLEMREELIHPESATVTKTAEVLPTVPTGLVLPVGMGSKASGSTGLSRYRWPLMIGGGVAAIAGILVWFNQLNVSRFNESVNKILVNVQKTPAATSDLAKLDTATVTKIALDQVHNRQWAIAKPAIVQLLERNALPQVNEVLSAVTVDDLNDGEVSFLRGRLAWQSMLSGDQKFDAADARRFWETAVKADPNSIMYLNALGFAYYTEKNYNAANQAWYNAIAVSEKLSEPPPEIRQTYAGLALGLEKLSAEQSGESKTMLTMKAVKLREKVLSEAPTEFQMTALSNNWMWSEAAIADWNNLLKLNP